jgi:hypothetical protein
MSRPPARSASSAPLPVTRAPTRRCPLQPHQAPRNASANRRATDSLGYPQKRWPSDVKSGCATTARRSSPGAHEGVYDERDLPSRDR